MSHNSKFHTMSILLLLHMQIMEMVVYIIGIFHGAFISSIYHAICITE